MSFDIKDILLLVGLPIAYWIISKKLKPASQKPKENIDELFQVKKIDDDGFVITEDNRYMMVLEVTPIQSDLKSFTEQKVIWNAYLQLANTIPHTMTLRAEQHPLDLNEYFQGQYAKAIASGKEHYRQYVLQEQETFLSVLENQNEKDTIHYLFLETDSRFLNELEFGSTNPVIRSLLNQTQKLSTENEEVAKQELMNSARVAQSVFLNVGIWTRQMNRNDFLSLQYRSINREMAALISYTKAQELVESSSNEKESIGKLQFGQTDKEEAM